MITAYFDGACSGNPGPMTASWIVLEGSSEVCRSVRDMGNGTNNQAEYLGLLTLLLYLDGTARGEAEIRGDSQLVVQQIAGAWRVRDETLRILAVKCRDILKKHPEWYLKWIPRDENAADQLLLNLEP
jgi:ribonuclease HI